MIRRHMVTAGLAILTATIMTTSTTARPSAENNSSSTEKPCKPFLQMPISITLSAKALTIKKGQRIQLKARISPEAAPKKKIIWKSSNPRTATVSINGIVKGIKKGTVIITASTINGKKAYCNVTVKEIPLKRITLNKKKLTLKKGATCKKLKVTYTPGNTTSSRTIKWSSSKKKVATVNSKGKITARKTGKTTITAKAGSKKAKCVVTVKRK